MENTIFNIAVISFPRTASRSLANWCGKKYNKPVALGSLHQPEYFGKNVYDTKKIVKAKTHILHGHWHSLHKLDSETLKYLMNNYSIFTSYREENLVRESLLKITGKNLFDEVMQKSLIEKARWNISKHYIIKGDNVENITQAPHGFC